jgi:hypothetical protein
MSSPIRFPRRALAAALAAAAVFAIHDAAAQAAGGWAPAVRLAEGSSPRPVGVAVTPDGTVTAAFVRNTQNPPAGHLEVAVKPPGGTFGEPQRLSATGTTGLAKMVRDEQGNVAVVWTEQVAGTQALRGATKPAGGAFTPPQTISDTGSYSDFPRLDIAGGTAVVAWAQGGRVRAATARAGEAFKVHDPLSPNTGFLDAPEVAAAPDGAAVVAWHQTKSGVTTLHAAARAAGGEFAPLEDIAQPPSYVSGRRMAMSADGGATLAWTYYDAASKRYVLQSASRGRTGEFGGVETVDTLDPQYGPYFGLDKSPDGTALLVWNDAQERYAVRPEGGGFGATHTISGSSGTSYVPEVKFGADGAALAVWRGSYAGRRSVEAARIAPDGASAYAEDIAIPSTQPGTSDYYEGLFGLDVDAQGNAAVSWQHGGDSLPGTGTQFFSALELRIFDTTPPTLADVQVPGTALTGQPVAMSATATDPLTPVTVRWRLGKFRTATGAAITPTYDTPGDYGVGIEAVDAAGNVTSTTRSIRIDGNPNPCPEGQICE